MKNKMINAMFGLAVAFVSTVASAGPIIEWAPFKIKSGVSDAEITQAAQAVEKGFLAKQPGYIKRSLLKGSKDQWVDIVYWQSEEAAQTAAARAMESPICFEYFALMQQSEHSGISDVQHYLIMKSWP